MRLVGSLLIGMAGIVVLNFPVIRHGSHADLVACLILLLAVCSWGIGSVMQKRRPVTVSAEVNSGYQLLFGAFFLLAASLLSGEPRPHPTTEAWLAWGYLVVFGSVIAFTSFVKALQLLPVHVVATYAYVNPVIAILLGWLILGERITPWTIADPSWFSLASQASSTSSGGDNAPHRSGCDDRFQVARAFVYRGTSLRLVACAPRRILSTRFSNHSNAFRTRNTTSDIAIAAVIAAESDRGADGGQASTRRPRW